MREGRGGYEVIDVLLSTRRASGAVSEQIPLLLRDTDILHVDYGRRPAVWTSSRVLGLAMQTLKIEREGRSVLTIDIGLPTEGSIKCSYDRDGFIRATFTFKLSSIYFGRTGYRLFLDG
ncbi:TPA: hypothetical protein DCE37_26270 [Candidatus Latescibacteria bacterium]|nr:hypothetical protein [Candidatus Latescibacterota bacterium]